MVEGRQWPAEDLVGREHELSRLRMFLREARSSGSRLMVTAPPGMGKTSLLRVAASTAVDGGAHVLYASGVEFEADVGFAALHQLLGPVRPFFSALEPRYAEALRVCTRAVLLLDGQVAMEGDPDAFQAHPLVLGRYLGNWRRSLPPPSL